jgi:hypothetical protein
MTVWIYVDISKQVGDRDHLKVFASEIAAETWLQENDPEGVAFEYEVWSEPHWTEHDHLLADRDCTDLGSLGSPSLLQVCTESEEVQCARRGYRLASRGARQAVADCGGPFSKGT